MDLINSLKGMIEIVLLVLMSADLNLEFEMSVLSDLGGLRLLGCIFLT